MAENIAALESYLYSRDQSVLKLRNEVGALTEHFKITQQQLVLER